ncbi:DegT/DnrJ/EryC1/StrS family aminotransferase [Sandaracinus amylolyticus]|uniref:DegT/DnrJ/EryC1/StrS aminotransferase n=1 Tax=Sandaracinus amylolyticus TaxID=927083 RepID=A0A0F6VZ79_9BACT|nr:DegT/DnrJ/EryC1/StrS family aminotransferase [Sandaracinus amylolyticus]AKF03221.1 DegT/DnrJ/EryC1/StrS aminotransferase [Sandaracinus amylolyticus]
MREYDEHIPVYAPSVTDEDAEAVAMAVRAGTLSGVTRPVREFERGFAAYCGAPAAVAVSSGTAALELALIALRIGPGDEVICPSLTIISCVRAILAVGATPVLVDVDPTTWCIDIGAALARVGPRTRALLAVHLFGHPVDLDPLRDARSAGVVVVEDAAQAIGAEVQVAGAWRRCGGADELAAFSFYANKTITTGEGGMLLGRDAPTIERARDAASLFFGRDDRFRHDEIGHNYRMSGVNAALGLSQLARVAETIARKRAVDDAYRARLADVPQVRFAVAHPRARPVPWMTAVVVDGVASDELRGVLARSNIETRGFFVGMHEQPALRDRGVVIDAQFPITEHATRHGLLLPSSPQLREQEIDRVCDALRAALRRSNVFRAGYAELYDAIYADKRYDEEVAAFHRVVQRFDETPVRRVLDLGCGTGRHARALASSGVVVTGVDRSASMLAIAAARNAGVLGVDFVHADIETFAIDAAPFDAALMMFAVLGYLADDDALARALTNVRRHLRAGALLVADVWHAPAVIADPPVERALVLETPAGRRTRRARPTQDAARRTVTVHYALEDDRGRELAREDHVVRYFDEPELRIALSRGGFELVHVGAWPAIESPPSSASYVACIVARAV